MNRTLERHAIRLMSLPPLLRTMNRALNRFPVILTLHRRANPEHGIGGHDPAMLRQQLAFVLRNGYRTVTMDVIDAWVNGEDTGRDMTNTVAFTFDDGYRDQAELIREVFVPLGVPASVFLITDFIDGRLWPWDTRIKWLIHHAPERIEDIVVPSMGLRERIEQGGLARRQLAHRLIAHLEPHSPVRVESAIRELAAALNMEMPATPPAYHAPMSWHEARELESSGVRFGSHSQSHYVFSGLSHAEAEQQIRNARTRLQSELATPLSTFGYPIGNRWNFTGRDLKILGETGHTSAVTMTPGAVEPSQPGETLRRFVINRYGMPDDLEGFIQCVSWIERLKDRTRAALPRMRLRQRYGSVRGAFQVLRTGMAYRLGKLPVTEPIEWPKVQRLVFLCQGNVCRSPFAEAIARQHGLPTVSCGLETDPGTAVNPIASRVALELGVDMTEHTSRRFDPSQLRDGDLVIGMEPGHLTAAGGRTGGACVQWTLLGLQVPGTKVPFLADPYGSSDAYHRRCFGIIRTAVDTIADTWLPHHRGQSTRWHRTPGPSSTLSTPRGGDT